jgi:hypothetical protein
LCACVGDVMCVDMIEQYNGGPSPDFSKYVPLLQRGFPPMFVA